MSAEVDLLREAARVMRERANAATPGPWFDEPMGSEGSLVNNAGTSIQTRRWPARCSEFADAEHIASWHPAVALAVADWLGYAAGVLEHLEQRGHKPTDNGYTSRALATARAYLGRQP